MDQAIGIIGGSGLYHLDGIGDVEEIAVETPFGKPSDAVIQGELAGRRVCFLARHGRGHRILPGELNHRANIWALRSLGVRWLISVTAVGSLRESLRPRDLVIPNQLVDRTSRRGEYTFFGRGIAAHVAFAQPFSEGMRRLIREVSSGKAHDGGTYVAMDGPAFSTVAESEMHRRMGFDLIGMTIAGEAKLAREAGIALGVMAFVTDYDCWKADEDPVTAETVIGHLQANADTARRILRDLVARIPLEADWEEHRALESAIITPRELWPPQVVEELGPLLGEGE